jgi:peptide deformylase
MLGVAKAVARGDDGSGAPPAAAQTAPATTASMTPAAGLPVAQVCAEARMVLAVNIDPEEPRRYILDMLDTVGETLPILVVPDPVLRAKCRPVGPKDEATVRALLPQMFATMYAAPGIGLAAPQVGRKLRFIVVDVHPDDTSQPIALINPEIVARSTELASREEGCLSLPGQYAEITRPARVKVRYLDETGARKEIAAEGLLAACLQHEIDHLNGVLFIDHLSALKRNIILRRLAKESRQKRDEER